VKTYLR